MKKLKVSIQDEQTLVLQEAGDKGDVIDLSSLHETDIDKTTITSVVNSIKKDAFNEALAKERANIEREKALEAKLKEQELLDKVARLESEKASAVELATTKTKQELQADLAKREAEVARLKAEKEAEIAKLHAALESAEVEKKLALSEAIGRVEKERDELASKLEHKDTEQQLHETSLKREFENQLKTKDEMIAYYKDMKARMSTKMVGETLEQHCEIEFNKIRATAFPNAYFGKDNDASSGSKGDYIYRETDENGVEIISIMFEMKNEGDETATKKTNDSFLKELDKDRTEKKCEYAVLVSLLEIDNELYNSGIVDVSYQYKKMYVIRPQQFLTIIGVLRGAALKTLEAKRELALIREQNIDITNFESELQVFQDGFMKNVKDSSSKFREAMDGIDATIKKLEMIKDALRLSNKHLLTAGGKVENISIKKLTKGNPTMAAKFEGLKSDK